MPEPKHPLTLEYHNLQGSEKEEVAKKFELNGEIYIIPKKTIVKYESPIMLKNIEARVNSEVLSTKAKEDATKLIADASKISSEDLETK